MTTASKVPPPPANPPSRPPVQPRRPPNKPNSPPIDPPSKGLAAELDMADLLLRSVGVLALPGLDPALKLQLAHGLTVARRAIKAAQTTRWQPGECLRRAPEPLLVAAVPESGGSTGGPNAGASPRAGRPPLPGTGTFSLPRPPEFLVGTARLGGR